MALLALQAAGALREDQPPPYVGTPARVIERMLSLAKVRSDDYVMDLGSGDGRIVLEAARRYGARALGIEMNGPLVAACREMARKQGLTERANCRQGDIFDTDLSQVSVLTLYLSPEFNDRLTDRILQTMRPGTRVVSHDFAVGAWTPDAVEQMHVPEKNFGRGGDSTLMLFVVPARASGRWRGTLGTGVASRQIEFSISQHFQMLDGAVHVEGGYRRFVKAGLTGDRIAIELNEPASPKAASLLTARIDGERMQGTYQRFGSATAVPFTAERTHDRPDLF